jgi:hypothetical protein
MNDQTYLKKSIPTTIKMWREYILYVMVLLNSKCYDGATGLDGWDNCSITPPPLTDNHILHHHGDIMDES